MIGVSIVVCCHNSAARIEATIEHLARQETPYPWEVVLVNNASTDDTTERAKAAWSLHGAPTSLTIVDESHGHELRMACRQGASKAAGDGDGERNFRVFRGPLRANSRRSTVLSRGRGGAAKPRVRGRRALAWRSYGLHWKPSASKKALRALREVATAPAGFVVGTLRRML